LIAFIICALARKHIQAEVLAAVSVVERHLASWPPERAHELRLAEVRVICRLCTPDLLGERRRPLGPAEVTGFVEAHHHREHLRLPRRPNPRGALLAARHGGDHVFPRRISVSSRSEPSR